MSETSGFELEPLEDCLVVTLLPDISNFSWEQIDKVGGSVLQELENQKYPLLLVDLSQLKFIGSSTVAIIVRWWKLVKEKRSRNENKLPMVVVSNNESITEVLQIAGLTRVWALVETREQGFYDLGISPKARIERRESRMLVLVSGATAFLGILALLLYSWVEVAESTERAAMAATFGCGGLALFTGLVGSIRYSGGRRILTIIALLLGTSVIGLGYWQSNRAEKWDPFRLRDDGKQQPPLRID